MITIEQIKNIVKDIKDDIEWVNDSRSIAEYLGVCNGLDMLVRHIEEVANDN